jgi:hypothetical protein
MGTLDATKVGHQINVIHFKLVATPHMPSDLVILWRETQPVSFGV